MSHAVLTRHFTWAEVTRSPTALRLSIDNRIPANLVPNIIRTAKFMEQVREVIGEPIKINSWYRCPQLNVAIGGSLTSVHMKGLATDWEAFSMSNSLAFSKIQKSDIPFDQLIHEGTTSGADWIHIGFSNSVPRRQVLIAHGKTLGGEMNFTRIAAG